MRILVIGANGLLGSNVVNVSTRRGIDVASTVHTENLEVPSPVHRLDIRDTDRFEELLETVSPTAIINCAAMTDVDGCESAEREAREVNAHAPGNLAEKCARRDIGFVHVSTDYVFDGTARSPYTEDSVPNPIQAYGRTKLAGERAVREAYEDALIVRLSFVYGVHRVQDELTGFPAWVRDKLVADENVPLFVDQRVTPTRAGHAAEALLDLVDRDVAGTVNIASRSCVSPFEFGDAISEHLSKSSNTLVEAKQDSVERAARRPQYTCLDTDRIEKLLGRPEPTLSDDLNSIASYLSR